MADTPQTLALLALGQALRGDVVRTVNRRSTMLRAIPIKAGSGQNAAWSVEGSGQLAENFSEGATASNFGSDSQKQALLSWARVRSNFHVTGTARRAAKSAAAGPGGVQDLIGRNMVNSSAAVASMINGQLFTGTGSSDQLTGLDLAIGSVSNTYATIDRTTEAYWRPYVIDPGSSTALTLAQIRQDLGAIYDACGEVPPVAFCKTNIYNTIVNLFESNRRYVQAIDTPRGTVQLAATQEGIEVDGCVFIKDKDCTAGQIYYLNFDYLELQYSADETALMAVPGAQLPVNDGYGALPLGIQCSPLAKNGDADRYQVLSECQLIVRKPSAMGIRKNVAAVTA